MSISHPFSNYRPARVKQFLSLGAGVQSSTMLFMAARGLIKPMPSAAICADTKREPQSVYRWLEYIKSCDLPFPIIVRTKGDLGSDNLKWAVSKRTGSTYSKSLIPAFIKNDDGSKGILQRRCTRDYKVFVVQKAIRDLLNKPRIGQNSFILATSWIGISIDEAQRMKPSQLPWIENRWPLIELGMTRKMCKEWMADNGYPEPPRSACTFCPYHSDTEWLRLKTEEPEDFAQTVQWERDYQEVVRDRDTITMGVPYLHSSLVQLDQVQFDPTAKRPDQFGNECEGMCGV